MKITFFSAHSYDRRTFDKVGSKYGLDANYVAADLTAKTVKMVDEDTDAVCVFVNDNVDASVLRALADKGVKIVTMRCAGFNNVDQETAKKLGIHICRVPAYSPTSVAEHAAALLLTLNRKTHKGYNRTREQDFSLRGLEGFEIHGKTVAIIGTGKIGYAFYHIAKGFGCKVVAYDPYPNKAMQEDGVPFLPFEDAIKQADIISLHCPLFKENHHMLNGSTFAIMKQGAYLINTSRGGLVDTQAAIEALKSKKLGGFGLDVYEEESALFFKDLSNDIIEDDTIQRLVSFPNVILTGHQAFFTFEALEQIAEKTLDNTKRLLEGTGIEDKAAIVVA